MERVRERKKAEEKEIRDEAYRQGVDMAVTRYQWHKLHSITSEGRKRTKILIKTHREGFDSGREHEHLTDKQILRKAEMINLEIKLGIKKEVKEGDKNGKS